MPTLFLLSNLCIGGSERKTIRIVNALHDRGQVVHLAWLNGPEALRDEIAPGVSSVCLERKGKFSWSALRNLERYIRTHAISKVVCINLYPLIYVKALRMLMGRSRPTCVVTVNTTEFASRKEAIQMVLYLPLMRNADGIIFGCNFQLDLWIKRYSLPKKNCHVILNGVDSTHFSAKNPSLPDIDYRATLGISHKDFVVGTVGKLRPEKQQCNLIEAVSRLRTRGMHVSALIVGSGEKGPALKNQAKDAGVADRVLFLGEMQDVRSALAAMDVFVLTSLSETFSNAALEAMAMGRPVVLSDVGGAREMVWDGVNGHLYPATEVESLSNILARLSVQPHEVLRMGKEAERIAAERFSFPRMINEYAALCGSI